MKVCFIVNPYLPNYGGGAYYIHNFIPYLKDVGIDSIVFTQFHKGLKRNEHIDDIEVFRYGKEQSGISDRLVNEFYLLFLVITKWKEFDILHFGDGPGHGYLSLIFAKLFGKKVVIESVLMGADDGESIRTQKFGSIKVKLINKVDAIFGISKAICTSFHNVLSNDKIINYVPYGIDISKFDVPSKEEKKLLKKQLGFDEHDINLIFIGAISKRKGIDFLIDVMELIIHKNCRYNLLLVGPQKDAESSFINKINNDISSKGLGANIHFLGERNDVSDLLKSADFYISGSHAEGLGIANIEAMACGLPSVVVDLPPFHDLYPNEKIGKIVSRDRIEFTNTIYNLTNDSYAYNNMSNNCREFVKKQFEIKNRAANFYNIYRNILDYA